MLYSIERFFYHLLPYPQLSHTQGNKHKQTNKRRHRSKQNTYIKEKQVNNSRIPTSGSVDNSKQQQQQTKLFDSFTQICPVRFHSTLRKKKCKQQQEQKTFAKTKNTRSIVRATDPNSAIVEDKWTEME